MNDETLAEAENTQRLLRALFRERGDGEGIVAVVHEAARSGKLRPLPEELSSTVRAALGAVGITQLYGHQRAAYDLLGEGAHVVVGTGTASGKSLCYQLPLLDRLTTERRSNSLLLFPTKALTQNQVRKLLELRIPNAVPMVYDGDTPDELRATVRRTATSLLTNPDMLHMGILPNHERWAEYLHHLHYVVIDEAHVYRGVFGSHTAHVIRRLRRLCALYGSSPQFILTSATIANPQEHAERLVGLPFTVVDDDEAPRAERTIVFTNPPLLDASGEERRSSLVDAGSLAAECIIAGARTIVFAPTRKAAELTFGHVQRALRARGHGEKADRVQPYRAGYTTQQRREIERRLFAHELDAVIATQALELGIDIGSLDVSLVIGFPGTIMSLRQRWGRAGRTGHGWNILVAGQDAIDQYFLREPERLLSRRVEEAIIDLRNPNILHRHLEAAAYEAPLTQNDETYLAGGVLATAERLAGAKRLRESVDGFTWAKPYSPATEISLRSASTDRLAIVEERTGEIIGEIEYERVFRLAHPGAIYLHLGRSYLVQHLNLKARTVFVEEFNGSYYTQVKTEKAISITGQARFRELPGSSLFFGEVEVSERVLAYQRRDLTDHRILSTISLNLPEQVFTTEALWLTIAEHRLEKALSHLDDDELLTLGSLHAAEHALIALLPLFALCDRWDIGGLSTGWHWRTEAATIFVYDGYPGGIGLAKRGYESFEGLAADARSLIAACPCEAGCPSCIQSPKCGNLNEPLHKTGAIALLAALLRAGDPS